jgi:hypothetical protein
MEDAIDQSFLDHLKNYEEWKYCYGFNNNSMDIAELIKVLLYDLGIFEVKFFENFVGGFIVFTKEDFTDRIKEALDREKFVALKYIFEYTETKSLFDCIKPKEITEVIETPVETA